MYPQSECKALRIIRESSQDAPELSLVGGVDPFDQRLDTCRGFRDRKHTPRRLVQADDAKLRVDVGDPDFASAQRERQTSALALEISIRLVDN
jgi:hypothetical protein